MIDRYRGQATHADILLVLLLCERRATRDLFSSFSFLFHTQTQGGAPEGSTFHDIEEEWVVDAHTGRGAWKAVPPPPKSNRPAQKDASSDYAEEF